jgi:molecular chaperone GrpE
MSKSGKDMDSKKHNKQETKEITLKIDEYEALKKELQEAKDYKNRLLRLQADIDNAKKRLEREKAEFVKYANEGIILELLGILDDLERSVLAAETKHQDPNAFLKGIEMILAHIYEMLKKRGVSPIEAKGKPFDPDLHEAMMQVETDEFDEDTVVEELQKGYMLEDRVIRTAKVKVAKKKQEPKDDN